MADVDSRIGRPPGDHGTANQAMEWAFDVATSDECPEADTFLRCWREGDLNDWPDFYAWLKKEGQ